VLCVSVSHFISGSFLDLLPEACRPLLTPRWTGCHPHDLDFSGSGLSETLLSSSLLYENGLPQHLQCIQTFLCQLMYVPNFFLRCYILKIISREQLLQLRIKLNHQDLSTNSQMVGIRSAIWMPPVTFLNSSAFSEINTSRLAASSQNCWSLLAAMSAILAASMMFADTIKSILAH